jgi:hypothetical protein
VALIDALEFQTADQMRQSIEIAVDYIVERSPTAPVAVYPVRNLMDFTLLNEARRRARDRWAVFEDFDPAEPLPPLAGSELALSSIITGLARRWGGSRLLDAPALSVLRTSRVREIVFVEDYAGSGRQSTDYAASWSRNTTISSWRSGQFVRTSLVVSAASTETTKQLRALTSLDTVDVRRFVNRPRSVEWEPSLRRRIEELCRKYGEGNRETLGYRESFGLFIPAVTVPNNVPWILRRAGAGWHQLFIGKDGRTMDPDFRRQVLGYRPARDRPGYRMRSSRRDRWRHERRWARLYDILAAVEAAPTLVDLESALRWPMTDLLPVLNNLQETGLIQVGARMSLTAEGVNELAALVHRGVSRTLPSGSVTYYPFSVKGVGAI